MGQHEDDWDSTTIIDSVLFSIRTSVQNTLPFISGREPSTVTDPTQLPDTQQAIDRLCNIK